MKHLSDLPGYLYINIFYCYSSQRFNQILRISFTVVIFTFIQQLVTSFDPAVVIAQSCYTTSYSPDFQRGSSSTDLRIGTWNVNRLSVLNTTRTNAIANRLKDAKLQFVALQEVTDKQSLMELLINLDTTRYSGFLSEYIPYDLRMAFIYDSTIIDSVTAYPLKGEHNQDNWAGRIPFVFQFIVKTQKSGIGITAVNIHAKADIPDRYRSYQKRKKAAEFLYQTLSDKFFDEPLLILGDFNDDIDRSIFKDRRSPYYLFREDISQFHIISDILTEQNISTTLAHSQPIDHLIVNHKLLSIAEGDNICLRTPLIHENQPLPSPDTLSDHYLLTSHITFGQSTLIRPGKNIDPPELEKLGNYPNPMQRHTTFNFTITRPQNITLTIYNLLGRVVERIIHRKPFYRGSHEIQWTPMEILPAGIYWYRLRSSTGKSIDRLMTILTDS